MKKAVLFDLDGTLLDTTDGILESSVYAARKLGLGDLPHETMLKFIGPPIQNSFIAYYGVDAETAQKAADIFRDYYKGRALFKAKPYSGLLETLAGLKMCGTKIAVATYKREDYAINLLKYFGITEYCDSMHGADNFNKFSKADIVNICIAELGERKQDVVLVGDTEHDAKGAIDAGVDFIGVTYGFGCKARKDVDLFPNIGCADSLSSIIELL